MHFGARLACISCGQHYGSDEIIYFCRRCGDLLEVRLEGLDGADSDKLRREWSGRKFTLWRYRELIPLGQNSIVSLNEGGTPLYRVDRLARWVGVKRLYVKFEGANPTGSFKDRGMSVGVSKAVELGKKAVICASTGNTSSSMSAYAAAAGLKAIVLVPSGKIAIGKLFQTILYGAYTIALREGFDKALDTVLTLHDSKDIYILNSVNAWRIEGQKTLAFELFEQMNHEEEYVVSIPVGNCGNIAAAWKGYTELVNLGILDKPPRLFGIQAEGASPFADMIIHGRNTLEPLKQPSTIASAIRIGKPVNWKKALRAVRESEGFAAKVSDNAIVEAQRAIAALEGIGVEPASAASIAGVRKLVNEGKLDKDAVAVCVATGTALKDPNPELVQGLPLIEVDLQKENIVNIIRRVIG